MGFIALERAKLHYVFENILHVVERLVSEKEAKMNKIFKVIWSKSKQCYVVVSELAKNTTGKKKIVVASIFAAMVAGQAMQVDATSGSFYDTGAIKGAIAIGKAGSTAPQATDENAIAIGQAARANGRGGVALGNDTRSAQNAIAAAWDSQATGKNSVAVGTGTRATGLSSTAVGDGAQATANGAVALGQSTESAGNSVAAGFNAKARSNNTVAIGVEANNDGSITNNASSVSVGIATRARAVGSMAMGVSADASGKYSLALGSGDVSGDYTDGTNHPTASGEKSIAIGFNSNAGDQNAISIGSDTEAANLNATAVGSGAKAKANGAGAFGLNAKANGENTFAAVGGTASGNSAIAIGSASNASKESATALGRNTTATGVNSSAIGAYSIASATDATALGRNANATANQSTALGTYSVASGQYGTGVGYQANASGANSTAVGVSAKANKEGASAMGPGARAYGNGAISFGYQALSGANIFNSAGNGSFNDASPDVTSYAKWGDSAIGLRAIASGGNATALGRSATATAANAIAIGGGNGDSATDNTEKTEATGEKSTAIGYNAKAKTANDLAVGRGATSSGGSSTALGYDATSSGEGSVAIGAGTDALGAMPAKQVKATAKNAIAIGRATQATSQDATAIGTDATASNTDAIAIGRKSNASGSTSIGFGYNTQSTATNTVAIGTDVSATAESAIALGRKTTASALNATAVGPIANASGKYSSAFGMSAAASKENSLALGTNANASLDKSVALGSDSTTATNATSQGSVVIGGKTITWNGAPTVTGTGMQVSVGAAGAERQIKNVAAGAVSANSTDAINGSQLYAVAEGLRTKYVSINSTETNNQNNDGAIGSNSMAIGPNASANNTNSMAIGPSASAIKSNSMAIGPNASSKEENSVAIGPNASATGKDSVVVGINSQVTSSNSVAFGNSALAKQNYNVAMGSEVTADGDNSVAMGRMASSTGMASLAIGTYGYNKSTASGKYSIAIGRDVTSSAEDAIAMGRNSQATANYALTLGAEANASQASGVALGYSSIANTASGVSGYNPNTGHSDTYTALSGKTLTSTLGAVSVGNATNTRQITGVAAGTADTDAVNVAQLKSVNLAFTGNTGNGGDVNLSKSKLAVEGGTNSFITTEAANKKLEIKTTQGKLKNTTGTVSVDGDNGLAVAQNVADVINQANADQSIKYKANGTGSNSVKLSDGLNFTNGTTTTATVGANGQVTFDLNTATQKSITDSATAVAHTISLGGDTGTTTAKSLTSGNVNFGVKSGSPTYLTTTANGNDVTLTINEQAIKNAAKDASSFKVKANATAAEDVKGGDTVVFNNGDNIAITQTGKTFKIATAKNVAFDTATIGTNTTIGSTGVSTNKVTVGNISIDGTNGINAGNKAITNVGTGRVANSNADDTNVANIGDVKAIATDAVANLSTNLGVTDGTNSGTVNLKNQSLKVVGTGVAKATVSGQTITVDVAKGTLTNNTTTGALTGTAGVVDANDMAAAVNTAITKAVDTATGTQKLDISAGGTDNSVNLKTQKLTVAGTGAATASLTGQTITVNVAEGTLTPNTTDGTASATAGVAKAVDVAAAINNANTVLGNKITAATQSLSTLGDNKFKLTADSTSTTGQALNQSGGLSFKIAGDGDLVSTKATTADTIQVSVKKGTLSTNTDGTINKAADGVVTADNMTTVVNDAITKAVTSAKDGSAWNISTNGGTATKVSGGNTVDLKGGDNIVVEQDPTDGKIITVKTKKDLTLDSVTAANTVKVGSGTNLITLDGTSGAVSGNTFTAGNASMNTTGFRLTGGPSMTTAGIDAGNKQITNLASGGTTATNAANIGDINAAISSLTTNLGKNTTIAYKANNAGGQTVSLADGFNFTNGTLTTAEVAANGVVKFNVTQGSLSTDGNGNITNTAGVATTDDVKNAVNTAITKAVDNATGTQKLDISAGGTDSSVNLKTQKLTVAGTGAATASLNGQTITVDVAQGTFTNKSDGTTSATAGVAKAADVASAINNANTALSQKITDATTSLGTLGNNTFTLKADSTDTTAQALNKSGGLAFKVAGDGDLVSTSATTDTVKVTVKKGELSNAADGSLNVTDSGVVTADNMKTVVNDAITKAVTSAKDGSAWNISTNGGTATKVSGGNTVDLINGDNIEITQDGTDGKKITVKTKKDLTVDSVTAGNTVINTSGLTNGTTAITGTGITTDKVTVGGLSIDKTAGINAGNKAITNVGTGIVANSNADNSNVANIGDVKTIANDAVANLSTNLGVTDGTNNGTVNLKTEKLKVVGTGAATTTVNGQTVTVDVAKGTLAANAATGALTGTAGVVDANDMATAVNTAITKAVDNATGTQALKIGGDTTATGSVNLKSDTLSVKGDNKFITTAASGNDITLTVNEQAIKTAAKDAASFKVKANSEAEQEVKGGETVVFNDGDNIEITQTGKTFKIATSKNVTFDTATIGGNTTIGSTGITTNKVTVGGISIDGTNGINAGSKQITNVASGGTTATNAANIGDINAAISSLTTNLGKNTTIAYKANNAGGQTVSLADGFNFTNGTLTTAEVGASGVVKFNVTQGALSTDTNGTVSAGTAGVATTADVASAVNSAVSTAVNNATGNQKLDISAGGTDSSVNLKTQKLTVAGTGAATASLNGQTITVNVAEGTFTNKTDGTTSATAGVAKAADVASAINNANTALSQKITDATTSLGTLGNNTFTLKADSTDTTAQALNKSGGLAFKVAGDGDLVSTSATTDTVKVTVKKGELSNAADGSLNVTDSGVVTADNMKTVVNDAITKAVTSAKDGSAWNISTNGGTATKVSGGNTVDLINGDNIEITQDGTDGKKITVKTKKDLTVDSVTAANTVKVGSATNLITLDGTTGAVSGNTFTAGNASMNTTGFRLTGGPSVTTTGIDAGNTVITNVASGGTTSTNAANIGDITKAISDLTTNLTKNTSISYTANNDTPVKTVSLKDGFNFTNGTLTTAEVAAGGVVKFNVTQGSLSTDGNGNITNTAGVATTDDVKNAVNTAINKAVTNSSTAVNTLGANTFTLTGDNSTSTTGQALNKNGGLFFKVAGDGNFITTSAATDTVTVSIKQGTFGSNTDGTAKSTTNGVATTNDVANIVNTTVTNAVTKATGAQVLNITDGNNNGSINLKNDALKVVGTDGVTTEVNGKTITVGLDTATKDKINNASVATNKNISLAADTGNASSQSLKDGDVSFAVKGATGDYISTNMNGSTVEISTKRATINSNAATGEASVTGNDGLATAKNVADAINAATAKAVSQSAWKLAADGTTGTETISGGDTVNFKAGSNMEVSRTGKDITYKTKDNVAFTTVTAGTGANEVKLDGNTGTVTAKDITATGDVTAKNVTTSGNVTAAGTLKGDTVQGNTVKAGNVTITGGTTNTITGLSNTTWTPAGGIQADRAATEGQLQQAINQVNATVGSTALTFKGDTNPAQSMTLQGNTFAITGDTMIKTTTNTNGIGLSLDTSKVNIAYAANGLNGQTTSIASGLNFTDGDHTKATVAASGVVKYDAKTSTISVANGHAAASGNDLATADNVADAINQMTQNNAGNTTQLRQEISKVATETQRVGAHAAAMAALKPIQYDPLAPTQIMAGVGNYRGESAAALGVAHYTNDNTMFNVGVSVGGNHNMINAGVTHKFGISAEKKNIPDRYKAGPISSIYVMQDEMTQLRSENEAYKAKLDKQQSEIDALKAAVDQLLASKA